MNQQYFDLLNTVGLQEHFRWLTPLAPFVERIVNFGCVSSEPFALMITLNATEIKVVDIEANHILFAQEELQLLRQRAPSYFLPRSVEFIVGDITKNIASLPTNYFDLAFCENVLYSIYPDELRLRNAIKEMMRTIRPGGWFIAIEPKIGAKIEKHKDPTTGWDIPIRTSNPVSINDYIEEVDLIKWQLNSAPNWSYSYQKSD